MRGTGPRSAVRNGKTCQMISHPHVRRQERLAKVPLGLLSISQGAIEHGGIVEPPASRRAAFGRVLDTLKNRLQLLLCRPRIELWKPLSRFPCPDCIFEI